MQDTTSEASAVPPPAVPPPAARGAYPVQAVSKLAVIFHRSKHAALPTTGWLDETQGTDVQSASSEKSKLLECWVQGRWYRYQKTTSFYPWKKSLHPPALVIITFRSFSPNKGHRTFSEVTLALWEHGIEHNVCVAVSC
ncbi:hypothetical protein EYF80_038081 [Liparis tanakae]|uniref:Uncharacterized protein n=1 Tax=Liparis tanakae TaxID=230148 RepID=A0A4Z2GET9_9TELE|nr:hypothetical protein EYF80_038081 [Liparis tanakae]